MYKVRLIDYDSKRDRHRHWYIKSVKASPRRISRAAKSVGAGGIIDDKKGIFIWLYGSMPDMYVTPTGIYCERNSKVAQNSAARVASILLANKLATGKRGKWRGGVKTHVSQSSPDFQAYRPKEKGSGKGGRRLV